MIRPSGLLALAALVSVASGFDDIAWPNNPPLPVGSHAPGVKPWPPLKDRMFPGLIEFPTEIPNQQGPSANTQPPPKTTTVQDVKSADEIAIEKVSELRKLIGGAYANYRSAEYIWKLTHFENSLVFCDGKLRFVGNDEFVPHYWERVKDSTFALVNFDLSVKDGLVEENFSFYQIKNGKSKAYLGKAYWKKIDGNYKIVVSFYDKTNKIL